jgi:hypothetical protein
MSVSTVTSPRLSSRTRAPDFITRLLRKPAATPMPVSQRPPRLPGPCVAAVPAEALGAGAQALHQLALREGPVRMLGIDLRVVDDAELDRVHAQLLRHLVHGDFQRHQARRLARRAHGVAFGQVEHASRSASAGSPRHKAAASGSTAVSGWPPGRSPDQLSCAMAVILPSGVAPMRMRWMVAGRCVVLFIIIGRCSASFTGRRLRGRRVPPAPHRPAGTACRRSRRR